MKFMALIIIFAGSIAFGNFAPTNSERKITLTIGEDDLNNVIQTIRRSKQFGVGGILPIYNIPYGFTLNQKAEQVDVLSHGKVDVSNLFPLNAWFFEPNGLLDNVDLPLKVSLITDVGNLVHIGYKADGKPTLNFCLDVDVNVAFEKTEIAKLDEILEEATQSFFFPADAVIESTLNSFCFSISDYLGIALPTVGTGSYLNTPQITTDPDNIYIEYELSESVAPDPIAYNFVFETSRDSDADTKANVFVDVEHCNGFIKTFNFKNASVGDFSIGEIKSLNRTGLDYGPVKKIVVRHDNTGEAPGWKLEKFSFYKNGSITSSNDEAFSIYVNKWISNKSVGLEGDGNAYWYPVFGGKTNIALNVDRSSNCNEADISTTYSFTVKTADWDYAGTSANVFLKLCGFSPLGSAMRCENFDFPAGSFTKGSTKSFSISGRRDIGDFYSMEIWHDNSGSNPGWRLNSIDVEKTNSDNGTIHKDQFRFYQWLAGDEADRHALRLLNQDQKFTFEIKTGTESYSGTDAKIDVKLCDVENSCTDWLILDNPSVDDFNKGSMSKMEYYSPTKLSALKKMIIRSDYSGSNPGWYVVDAKVIRKDMFADGIEDITSFNFNQWLAKDWLSFDPETSWENNVTGSSIVSARNVDSYKITISIKTSDIEYAGTDAKVVGVIKGSNGEHKFFLDHNGINDHERGRISTHIAVRNSDIGIPERLTLMHDNKGDNSGWHVEYADILIDDLSQEGSPLPCRVTVDTWIAREIGNAVNNNGWLSLDKDITDGRSCLETSRGLTISSGTVFLAKKGGIATITGSGFGKTEGNVIVKAGGIILPVVSAMQDQIKVLIPDDLPYGNNELIVTVGSQQASGKASLNLVGKAPKILAISNNIIEQGSAFIIKVIDCDPSITNVVVKIGGINASVLSIDGDYIKVKVPDSMPTGKYALTISSGGTINDLNYESPLIEIVVGGNPLISYSSMDTLEVGDLLTIYGSNFGNKESEIRVLIGGIPARIVDFSSRSLQIRIPDGINVGIHDIVVIRSGFTSNPYSITIDAVPDFMTFNTIPTEWSSTSGNLYEDCKIRQGNGGCSIRIEASGYTVLSSPPTKSASFGRISHQLSLDIFLPNPPQNQYWYGDISMSIDIPGANIYNAHLGNSQLTGLPLEQWSTLSFNIDDRLYDGFAGDYPNIVIHINVNTPSTGPGNIRIDNLRFTNNPSFRTVFHQSASRGFSVYVPAVFSFDLLSDWSSTADMLLVASPIEQGTGAISVFSKGWTQIDSRIFATKELNDVGSMISFDLFVPSPQPNPWWIGSVAMDISCPNKGINSYRLGEKDLTHLFIGEYNSIQFPLSKAIQTALMSNDGLCSVSLKLNTAQSAEPFIFDNLGFY